MGERVALAADRQAQAWKLLQPTVPVLVTTLNEDERVNIAPFGWVTPVSADPPMLALALQCRPRRNLSLRNILRTGEFTVNVVGAEWADRLVKCSHKLPVNVNKFEASGFVPVPSVRVRPPGIEPARAIIECTLFTALSPGDHAILVGRVVAASYDSACFDADLTLKPEVSFPCLHLEQYDYPDRQRHLFLGPGPARAVEVGFDYPLDVLTAFKDTDDGEEGEP